MCGEGTGVITPNFLDPNASPPESLPADFYMIDLGFTTCVSGVEGRGARAPLLRLRIRKERREG